MAQSNPPPLDQFLDKDLVEYAVGVKIKDKTQIEYLRANLEDELKRKGKEKPQASQLIAAEAELLVAQGCRLSLQGELESPGIYQDKAISLKVSDDDPPHTVTPKSFSRTLAHEMMHGIDDLYQCRSEDKTKAAFEELSAGTLVKGVDKEIYFGNIETKLGEFFKDARMEKFLIEREFTSQVKKAELVAGELSDNQLPQEILIPRELGAYIYEVYYFDIDKPGFPKNFNEAFNKLAPVVHGDKSHASREVSRGALEKQAGSDAQELIALSIYDVNAKMIEHMRSLPGREDVISKLESIQTHIGPAYKKAMERACMASLEKAALVEQELQEAHGAAAASTAPKSGKEKATHSLSSSDSEEDREKYSTHDRAKYPKKKAFRIEMLDDTAEVSRSNNSHTPSSLHVAQRKEGQNNNELVNNQPKTLQNSLRSSLEKRDPGTDARAVGIGPMVANEHKL